tara:strand:- start:635 stop:3406 length:2772 start_codon:yes stop_codon:yes gene_type:complete
MSDKGDVFYNGITVDADGDATIDGDLTVKGTTTTVESTSVLIDDKLLELAHGTTGTPAGDAGIIVERGDSTNSALIWDESEDAWVVCTTAATGSSSGDLTITPSLLAAGSIGIGTTSPSSNLEIEGSSGDLAIEIDNNATNSANLKIVSGAGNARADFVLDGNNHLTMKSQRVAIVGTNPQHTLDVTGDGKISTDLTVGGDIIIDDGGSLKEAGGTAAFTFDGSGNVTKIGQDSPSSGQFLKWDGSKWVSDAVTGVVAGSVAADDITAGDAAVTIATTSGNITIDAQAGDADIIFKGTDNAADVTALTLDMSEAGAAIFNAGVTVGTDLTVTDDIILDDGGSLKEAGGTAAITFDGSGNVTKIGQDSMSSGDVLTWDGAKFVGEAPTTGDVTAVSAGDGLTGGGTSGALSLAVGAGTGIDVAADAISVDVSDFMTNGSDNRVVTATGADAMNGEANLTFDGNTLTVTDAVTDTNAGTFTAVDINFDKTGDSTTDNTMIGLNLDMDNTSATNGTNTMVGAKVTPTLQHASAAGTTLVKGIEITATGSGPGNTTTRALDLTATGADFNQGLFMKIDDGGPDIKMLSSADTGDFCTMATGANGAFTITTTDDDGANGHINLMPDGNVGIGTDSPAQILQVSDAAPIVVVQNTTNEHTDGGAESKVLFADHAGNALSQVEGAHSGSSDDAKGQFKVSVNNGSGMQLAMSIDDTQLTTFSGDIVVAGTNPKLTIGDAGAEDTMLVFDGNAQDYRIGLDDGTDTLEIGVGTAHGTTPALTVDSSQNIDVFKAINLDSAIADNSVCGITSVFTAGEALNRGDVVYFKAADSKMHKVNMTAGNSEAIPAVAMAADDISADAVGKFLLQGFIHDAGTFPSYTVAGRLYAPEAEGPPTQTKPSTDGDLVQVIGWAVTADKIYFNPSPDYIEVA